ncbi:hypothetical protein V6N11_073116 [Hibiscus sabdariffa]|uniref:Uncharacterized protein n=1 Tax=Hibiscus sabdariffa TaxID=183260 RepID=A0ABR2P952_9ROSI
MLPREVLLDRFHLRSWDRANLSFACKKHYALSTNSFLFPPAPAFAIVAAPAFASSKGSGGLERVKRKKTVKQGRRSKESLMLGANQGIGTTQAKDDAKPLALAKATSYAGFFLRRGPLSSFYFRIERSLGACFYLASGTPQQEPKPLLGPLPGT